MSKHLRQHANNCVFNLSWCYDSYLIMPFMFDYSFQRVLDYLCKQHTCVCLSLCVRARGRMADKYVADPLFLAAVPRTFLGSATATATTTQTPTPTVKRAAPLHNRLQRKRTRNQKRATRHSRRSWQRQERRGM